jgi:hypothetical protein
MAGPVPAGTGWRLVSVRWHRGPSRETATAFRRAVEALRSVELAPHLEGRVQYHAVL